MILCRIDFGMIEIDDWSKLITVNFRGGMGGDFFSILLNNNFKQTPYNKTALKQYVYSDCPFASRWPYFKKLKAFNKINTFFRDIRSIDRRDSSTFEEIKFFNVYANSGLPLEQCLNEYFFDNYHMVFNDERFRVTNIHNLTTNFYNSLDLQIIFPKSKNIDLHSFNYNYVNIAYNLLCMYKLPIRNLLSMNRDSIAVMNNSVNQNNNSIFVDFYSLIFEDKSYDEQLSDLIGESITLNKNRIAVYRDEQIEILKQFNIDPYKQYPDDHIIEIGRKIFDMRVNGRTN